jgi:hypothetical protein
MTGAGELREGWQQDLSFQERARIADLIRALDSPYQKRQRVVNRIISLESGPTRALVFEYLQSGLQHRNSQIRGGTVETMARIGDPRYVTPIINMLPYEMTIDVRLMGVSLLPVFLTRNDTIRQELLELLYDANFRMTDRLVALLRHRPLRKDGMELEAELARLRRDITNGLAQQLDPIGTLLRRMRKKRKRFTESVRILRTLTVDPLEGIPLINLGPEIWVGIRAQAPLRQRFFLTAIQQRSAQLLSAMGGVEAAAALEALGRIPRDETQSTVLNALASLSTFAHRRWSLHEEILGKGGLTESAIAWRRQEQKYCVATVTATFRLSRDILTADAPLEKSLSAVYRALGASARPEAVKLLRTYGVLADRTLSRRAVICQALGAIGGEEAVRTLGTLSVFKGYGTSTREREEEYRVALMAIRALGSILIRPGDSGAPTAVLELARLLADTRSIGTQPSIRALALRELQIALNRTASAPPAGVGWVNWQQQWISWYKEVAAEKPNPRRAIIPESVFQSKTQETTP